MPNPMLSHLKPNNPMQMLQQFNQFKKNMEGKDPEAMVNDLLKSGRMSPQQFEQLKAQAQSFMSLLN